MKRTAADLTEYISVHWVDLIEEQVGPVIEKASEGRDPISEFWQESTYSAIVVVNLVEFDPDAAEGEDEVEIALDNLTGALKNELRSILDTVQVDDVQGAYADIRVTVVV